MRQMVIRAWIDAVGFLIDLFKCKLTVNMRVE